MAWDVFISHASEDKEDVARPLAHKIQALGYRVWLDEDELLLGDSLRQKIDHGLAHSRYGIVILSPDFLAKGWPQLELDGLLAREVNHRKVILPIWHHIDHAVVIKTMPSVAGRLAISTDKGLDRVALEVSKVLAIKEEPSVANEQPSVLTPYTPVRKRGWPTTTIRRYRSIVPTSLAVLVVAGAGGLWYANADRTYDAVKDFSLTNGGTWRYGLYACKLPERFVSFQNTERGTDHEALQGYFAGSRGTWVPLIDRNTSGRTLSIFHDSIEIPPNVLRMHPGPFQQSALEGGQDIGCLSPVVVRWTAPATDSYHITGSFEGLDLSTTTTGRIADNTGKDRLVLDITNKAKRIFDLTMRVEGGAHIDFIVDNGPAEGWTSDSTGFKATIARSREPAGATLPAETSSASSRARLVQGAVVLYTGADDKDTEARAMLTLELFGSKFGFAEIAAGRRLEAFSVTRVPIEITGQLTMQEVKELALRVELSGSTGWQVRPALQLFWDDHSETQVGFEEVRLGDGNPNVVKLGPRH